MWYLLIFWIAFDRGVSTNVQQIEFSSMYQCQEAAKSVGRTLEDAKLPGRYLLTCVRK